MKVNDAGSCNSWRRVENKTNKPRKKSRRSDSQLEANPPFWCSTVELMLTNKKIREETEHQDHTGPDADVYKFTRDSDTGLVNQSMAGGGA